MPSESIFTKFIADTLEREPKVTPPTNLEFLPAGKLLNWLLHHWKKPTVTTRELCQFGPRPREWKEVVGLAEALAKQGWLLPMPASTWWKNVAHNSRSRQPNG
jgi:hypothetical protein